MTRKYRQSALVQSQNKQENISRQDVDYKVESWFDEIIKQYRKQVLAYQIEDILSKYNVELLDREPLWEIYGKVLIRPRLYLMEQYQTLGYSIELLNKVENQWLNKHGEDIHDPIAIRRIIERVIMKETKSEAEKIVDDFIKTLVLSK